MSWFGERWQRWVAKTPRKEKIQVVTIAAFGLPAVFAFGSWQEANKPEARNYAFCKTGQACDAAKEIYACKDRDTDQRWSELHTKGDKDGLDALRRDLVARKACKTIEAGSIVRAVEEDPATRRFCLRTDGDAACYWAPRTMAAIPSEMNQHLRDARARQVVESRKVRCDTNSRCTIIRQMVGCIDYAVVDKIGSYLKQGDDVAFTNYAGRAFASGQCHLWKVGETAYKQEAGFFTSCLRLPGAETCFWTNRDAVDE